MRLQEHQTLEWISFAWLILAFALFCPSFGFPAPPTGVSEGLGKGLADIAEAIHEDGARDRVEFISRSTVQSRNEAGASSSHSRPQAQAFMDTGASASGSTSGVIHVFVPHYSAYIPIQYSPVPVTFLHPATQRALHPSTNMLVHYEGQPHLLFAHQPTSVPIAARPVQAVPAAYSQEARLATPSQPQGSDPPFNLRAPQHSARGQSFAATTSSTHTQRDISQTGGSANAAGVVQGKPTLAEILPRHSQKKMKLSQRLWTSRMERERSRKGITEQSQMSGTDPLVRQTAVDNVESLSDSKFRLFEEEDPQVNTLISSLRRTKQPEQDSGVAETSRPVRPYSQNAQKPSLLASRTFFHRKQAVQLLLKTSEGQRSLFVTYVVRPSWMPPSPTQGYIGVWEIAPSLDPEALGLYLRGFFPFLPLEFEALEHLPQATGMKYWFWKDRTKDAASLPTFNLYIAKVDPVMVTEPQELHRLQDIPEIQALEQSGQLQAVHSLSRTHMGRHNYAYMESPETVDLINQWKIAAELGPTSFRPIPLTQEQIENLSANMAPTYRNWRVVKVLANQNGELYMLSWITKIPWLKHHRGAAVVVWKIGPVIDERRLLIAKGFYGLKKGEWERLTPENVPGLRYSRFQRGMAELP